jgi:hypothetical protein
MANGVSKNSSFHTDFKNENLILQMAGRMSFYYVRFFYIKTSYLQITAFVSAGIDLVWCSARQEASPVKKGKPLLE